jgi:glycerophosphoryl diester phosphodiesterase
MRYRFIFILFQLFFVIIKGSAQTNSMSPVYLTNYTFSDTTNNVGYVKVRAGEQDPIQKITIKGKSAGFFGVTKDYQLYKKKNIGDLKFADIVLVVKTSTANFEASFKLVKDEFIRNKVVAHRGAWKNTGATENSVASLRHAIALGCEGSEFDVHMSADSVLFIHHDAHVQDVSIAKSASAQLRQMKLSNGESLPTLEAYLTAGAAQNKTKLVLEIKTSELGKESSIALTQKVVQLVERLHLEALVDYIAFDYDVCKEVMRIAPYAKVSYLNGDKTPTALVQDHFFGLDYHFSVLQKNPEWVNEAKQNKLTVNVWTVNDSTMMEALLLQKVDFITTNEPEQLLRLVASK